MAGRFAEKMVFYILALMILASVASGATIRVGNGPANDANSIDVGLLLANSGDTILLDNNNGTINSTLTAGNITIFDRDLFIDFSSGSGIATVRMNNSIQFKGNSYINFSVTGLKLDLWYDPATGGSFINDTLVQFLGSTDLFNSTAQTDSTLIINATAFTGTALNISSNNNGINLGEDHGASFTGHITGNSKIGVNISGQNNYLHFQAGSGGDINATDIAINLVGKNNHIILDTDNMLGSQGRLYICEGATDNYIHDYLGDIGYPQFSIYNGSAYSDSGKWGYFYNSSWSPSGRNMDVTISVRNLPYGGNVSIKALYNNVTGTAGDHVLNGTLIINSSAVFGGQIHNSTESTVFGDMVNEVPVKYTLGGNTLHINWPAVTYVDEYDVGSVRIINFNPFNSITTMSLNATHTSNWTEYADFSAVKPVFVVDNGSVDYKLLGNLTFAENINLLDLATVNQLQQLANGIVITNSSVYLDSTTLGQFNKKAVLTVYPAFNFTTTADLVLKVTPDGGAQTTLWDGNTFNSQGYLTSDTILVNTTGDQNSTTIWTNHFSNYVFSEYTVVPTPTSTATPTPAQARFSSSGGGSGSSNIGVGAASGLKAGDIAKFKIDRTSIFEVTATVNKNVPKMMITVEKRSFSGGIDKAPVDVYEYDVVNIYWAEGSDIERGTLEFKVAKDWLSQNGYSYEDVVMLRYNEAWGAWERLPTEYTGEENGYYLYRATTRGFSWFAIGIEEGATIVAEEEPAENVQAESYESAIESGAEAEETTATPSPTAAPFGAASFAVIFIAGVVLFLKRR